MFPTNYIAATTEYNTAERYVPQPLFRRVFAVKAGLTRADLTIGSLGYYEVHINGIDITKGLMAPYRSAPNTNNYFDRYEITDHLKAGKNCLGALLGNGIQNSIEPTWNFDELPWRSAPALAFTLTLTYADGVETIESDAQTLCTESPILFNDFHYGEYYDARLEQHGWDLPDFDDSAWRPAISAEMPEGEPRFCEAEPIRIVGTRKPTEIRACKDGSFIYDFGINDSGLCLLKIDGKPDQKIILRYFETLQDGKPYLHNIRFAPDRRFQEDEYTCAGGEATHLARFTYHGFRYVWISGIEPEQATEDLLTCQLIRSDVDIIGSFTCSNELINKLQECTLRSDLSNLHYFPTDCPHREKNGWTADASLSTEQFLLNLAPEKSYREWLRNVYKSMNEDGALPGIIPTGGWGFDWGNGPAWDNVIAWLPYFTYRYRGDRQIIEEAAAPLLRYLRYLQTRRDENGLLAFGLGDWCQVATLKGRYFDTPLIVTDSILSLDIARKAAFIYEELNMTAEKAEADALADSIYSAIRTHLVKGTALYGETQTAQAMGIFYDIFTEEEKPAAFAHLIELIEAKDNFMSVGVLGGRCIFRVLADFGRADLALHMMLRPEFPSYGNWIIRGATTLWEVFNQEGESLSSRNHHFWGDISTWFYRYLGGIDLNPTAKDVNHLNIAPLFPNGIDHAAATHRHPQGEIAVQWQRDGNAITLNVTVPAALHGKILAPDGLHFENSATDLPLQSGSYILK